ncbi:MAG: hypothetical protein CL855_01820 [Cryomorphaceae bacterium]|nr:hypothetical protein [Cryomorphaceae bacterium]
MKITKSYTKRKQYRRTIEELRRLTDQELNDIGINRGDIHSIARMDSDMNTNLRGWV